MNNCLLVKSSAIIALTIILVPNVFAIGGPWGPSDTLGWSSDDDDLFIVSPKSSALEKTRNIVNMKAYPNTFRGQVFYEKPANHTLGQKITQITIEGSPFVNTFGVSVGIGTPYGKIYSNEKIFTGDATPAVCGCLSLERVTPNPKNNEYIKVFYDEEDVSGLKTANDFEKALGYLLKEFISNFHDEE